MFYLYRIRVLFYFLPHVPKISNSTHLHKYANTHLSTKTKDIKEIFLFLICLYLFYFILRV